MKKEPTTIGFIPKKPEKVKEKPEKVKEKE